MPDIRALDTEDMESLRSLARSTYLNGSCYAFALALHQGLGWPLAGLVAPDGTVHHAFVEDPDRDGESQRFLDVRGRLYYAELLKDISGLPEQFELEAVDAEALASRKPIGEHEIERALSIAQGLWPELRWITGPLPKYLGFLEGLEALSKKHGVYLFTPYETAWPVLTKAEGDEAGYRLKVGPTGARNCLFNRVLPFER